MKKIFLVIVLLIAVFTTIAQPLCQIEHFTVNNGLAQGVVTTILQDKKGFIWFSTWNGATIGSPSLQKADPEISGARPTMAISSYSTRKKKSLSIF